MSSSLVEPSTVAERDPSNRYQKGNTTLEETKINIVYSAFDIETAVEVAWIEYRRFPSSVLASIEKQIPKLLGMQHANIVTYHQAWVDKKQKKVIFITEAMPVIRKGSITTLRRLILFHISMHISIIFSLFNLLFLLEIDFYQEVLR